MVIKTLFEGQQIPTIQVNLVIASYGQQSTGTAEMKKLFIAM